MSQIPYWLLGLLGLIGGFALIGVMLVIALTGMTISDNLAARRRKRAKMLRQMDENLLGDMDDDY